MRPSMMLGWTEFLTMRKSKENTDVLNGYPKIRNFWMTKCTCCLSEVSYFQNTWFTPNFCLTFWSSNLSFRVKFIFTHFKTNCYLTNTVNTWVPLSIYFYLVVRLIRVYTIYSLLCFTWSMLHALITHTHMCIYIFF